jgi:hypothetical protein
LFQGGRQQAALSIFDGFSASPSGAAVSNWIATASGAKYNLAGAGF